MADKPVVAVALGDPAGISAELAAKLLAGSAPDASLLVLGDKRLLALGAEQAGVTLDLPEVSLSEIGYARPTATVLVDLQNCDPADITARTPSEAGGHAALDSLRCALAAADLGYADSVLVTPHDSAANRLSQPDFVDDVSFIARTIQADHDGTEFNILDGVWTARVTGHIPLSEVPLRISAIRVLNAIRNMHEVMERAGFSRPRIAVAGLNPHAGDGRNFGHEDADIIAPAVAKAGDLAIAAEGPMPADTAFLRALDGGFDGVLTMYHDQGQAAMTLSGFDRGVTLVAGHPFPVVTPAGGSQAASAGRGTADPAAAVRALELACRLARSPANAPFRDETLEDLFARARAMGHAGGAAAAASAAAALAL